MSPSEDLRHFSSVQHRHHRWETSPISSVNRLTSLSVRVLSFKYRELFRLSRLCQPWYRVVDLGCGTGAYSGYFQTLTAAPVIAVDWSYEALAALSLRYNTVLPVCADAQSLPFKPGTIDMLFTIDTLGHCTDQCRALDEINRICRNGAPLFLHSECSDYRLRWPDRWLIRKLDGDRIAAMDGHFGIVPSAIMQTRFEQRFTIRSFFSPAGITGWLTGYPEKYAPVFGAAGASFFALLTRAFAKLKGISFGKVVLRVVNNIINRLELSLGICGGGSCFAQAISIAPQNVRNSRSLDIIIPTLHRAALLPDLLRTVLLQCSADDRLFIVWQDATPPPIPDDPRCIAIKQKHHSLPEARNRGIRAGNNPLVLFIDDDCVVMEGLLDAHRACFNDPSVAAVAGFIDDPVFTSPIDKPSCFDIGNGSIVQNFRVTVSGPTVTLMGANMSFRRSALEAIGGFDSNFKHNAIWEDVDAAFRVQTNECRIWYCAEAKVRHVRGTTGGCRNDTPLTYLYYYFSNTAYFCCTYAPRKTVVAWFRFWLYHLEYFARCTHRSLLRHHPLKVGAGLCGFAGGTVRFLLFGTRKRLPDTVVHPVQKPREGAVP